MRDSLFLFDLAMFSFGPSAQQPCEHSDKHCPYFFHVEQFHLKLSVLKSIYDFQAPTMVKKMKSHLLTPQSNTSNVNQ